MPLKWIQQPKWRRQCFQLVLGMLIFGVDSSASFRSSPYSIRFPLPYITDELGDEITTEDVFGISPT